MNIYDFFNSPDVAAHCQSIGHTFTAVESAIMVSQSASRTLAEKHEAYRAIIAEHPDMEIPKALNRGDIKSVHKALGDIIRYEGCILENLLTSEPCAVYQASWYASNRRPEEGELFTTYGEALADALDRISDDACTVSQYRREDTCVSGLDIRKRFFGTDKTISARLSLTGEIIRVYEYGIVLPIPRTREDELGLLEACYVDIPTPFKRGDLVTIIGESQGYLGNVYVLKTMPQDNPRLHAEMLRMGDISDMNADFYYESDGVIECEAGCFYPDLQYCREKLEDETRMLHYVSLYMQDKLCLCSLLKIQRLLPADKVTSKFKKDHSLQYELDQIEETLLTD